ncbi:esterase-like activity of phytase family protein [Xanthobacter sp. AM11]|uniref:esterase-like activity of phytase family protein n=1 Tax=Xanthobacter sp. AM11 TaxID=3380643 RepID=UPI0039BEDB7A
MSWASILRLRVVRAGLGLAFAGVAIVGLAAALLAKPLALPQAPEAIAVAAAPIATFRLRGEETRFGALAFRGGLVLTSPFPGFGGISGFALSADQRFLAVTDAGLLLSGRLDLDGDRPTGLSDVRAAALLDTAGRIQARRGRDDAEAVALAPDATYVALEDVNEIWRYPRDPLGKTGTQVPAPAVRDLRNNLGLESLAFVPAGPLKGALIGIGEEGASKEADLPGFIIGGRSPGTFTIARSTVFNATDLAIAPSGHMYLLERHYAPMSGVRLQIRRFALAEVKPGARLAGEVLGTFDMAYEIDNMEAIAVTTNAAGETLLTLVSDDNFNPLQRTILLRFAVVGE